MRLCLIYNYAQHYRSSIFKLIDTTYQCDFFFGKDYLDVKKMDYDELSGPVTEVEAVRIGRFVFRKGIIKLLWRPYDSFLLLGETRDLSIWLFAIIARLFFPRKKVFFWSHGWYGKESGAERFLKRFFFKLPNGGVFLYGYYAKRLMIQEGFNDNKLYVIHNSLAYEQQLTIRRSLSCCSVYSSHFGNDYPTLLFVGRLTAVKHLDMIMAAMAICNDQGKQYNLVLIGGGAMEEELKGQCRKMGLDGQVWFYGPCYDEAELGSLIYNADLCVSPGNVGLTAIHSMMFGTPVLTHNDYTHQMPEFESIHPGKTGDFFEYANVESLAQSINAWFAANGPIRDCVRSSCYDEIDNYWTPQFQLSVLNAHLL